MFTLNPSNRSFQYASQMQPRGIRSFCSHVRYDKIERCLSGEELTIKFTS
jgi:hypothetical protein